ncbi:hypothetical protein [uncultured Mitsuokella sp.]|uniref:hypothetical protein n=1 Tax=uncultured Mitsuokella sp. TaxID=453120 RepID=UPI00258E1FEA|nr:hypothetical protein [uncultured Mitsuokella sp.]
MDEIADDLTNYLCRIDDYFVAHRVVKTRIFGNRTVHAYVTLGKSGSYRLFFTLVSKAKAAYIQAHCSKPCRYWSGAMRKQLKSCKLLYIDILHFLKISCESMKLS